MLTQNATAELERVRALNYDHHRRMTEEHLRQVGAGQVEQVRDFNAESLAALLAHVPLEPSEHLHILELGASDGKDFPTLEAHFGTVHVEGLDVHAPSVVIAQERGHKVIEAFVEDMPYPDDSFDLVISRHLMEHVYDVKVALDEISRVLKPGGVAAAVTPDYHPDPEPAHIQQLTRLEWRDAYEENGYAVIHSVNGTYASYEAHTVAVKDA